MADSKILLRCGVDSLAEDRTCDWMIDNVEGVHDTFYPGLVDVHHELADSFLGLLTVGVVGQQGTLSSGDRRMRSWRLACRIRRIRGCIGVRVHQEQELDIATSQITMHVIVLEPVDVFQIASNDQYERSQYTRLLLARATFRRVSEGENTYRPLLPHCTSSTISRLLCTMN